MRFSFIFLTILIQFFFNFNAHSAEWVNHYEVLGLNFNASPEEIKQAYRKIALRTHPDRNSNDPKKTEEFKKAAAAYAVLSDEQKRAQYNQAFSSQNVGTQKSASSNSSLRRSELFMMELSKYSAFSRPQVIRYAMELMHQHFDPLVKAGRTNQALFEVADVWNRLALWVQYNGDSWNVAEAALTAGFEWIKQIEFTEPALYQHYYKVGYQTVYNEWLSAKQSNASNEVLNIFGRVLHYAGEKNSNNCEVILNGQRVKFTVHIKFN